MIKTLDRTQPYAECFGSPNGARFLQGGYEFDAAGRVILLGGVEPPAQEQPLPPEPVAVTVDEQSDDARPKNGFLAASKARGKRRA